MGDAKKKDPTWTELAGDQAKRGWKQRGPRLQLRVVLGAIAGEVDNLALSVTFKTQKTHERIQHLIAEALALHHFLPDSWPMTDPAGPRHEVYLDNKPIRGRRRFTEMEIAQRYADRLQAAHPEYVTRLTIVTTWKEDRPQGRRKKTARV